MQKPKLLIFLLLFLLVFSPKLRAQTWEIGGNVGEAGYIGDLNPTNPIKFTNVSAGGFIKRNINTYFSLKLNYMYGTISGGDSTSANQQLYNRNLSFTTSLSEISLIAEFNFMDYLPELGTNKFTPFIFAGFGSVNYNPKATYKGIVYELRPLMTEGQATPYKKQAWVVPYGAGMKFNFAGKFNFIVDLGYRNTNTGYLDDVYGAYADKSKLLSPVAKSLSDRSGERLGENIGTAGAQRGNYEHDTYMFIGFTLSYTFVTQNCYRF